MTRRGVVSLWVCLLAGSIVLVPAGVPSDADLPGIPVVELFPGARFDPAIPTQAELLGVEPGARPLRHPELIRYLERLAHVSPRAVLRDYSNTHEGRRMVVFIVSDQATVARLDDFREEHAQRVDPRGRPPAEDAALLEPAKAVGWMAYGIHGDELSSVDAAAAMAYWLVAGEDDLAKKMRRELVVLIDPCENPDGRERFLSQTQSFAHAIPNPDTEDLSHTTVWPWGRGNHYLFDLNRDWFSMVHPESRRSAVIASWDPQLMVDSHEMGAHDTYLLSPPRHPFNPHVPEYEWEWSDRFAADQARGLDQRGYPYYTREWNEEFFPGYGSSWASYRGAIGILYEMSSTEGTLVQQRRGTRRTYPQAVEHQVASSIANLTTLADNRAELLTDFVNGRREIIERGKRGPVGAWVLPEGRHPERTEALVRLLRTQGIEVLRATSSPAQVSGLRDARTGESVDSKTLPEATWMVPLDQPAGAMVRALLDPHVPMDAKFFREEREHLERDKGTRLYEVTSWSLPLARGIEAYWTAQRPATGWSDEPLPVRGGTLLTLEGSAEPFGYVMPGTSDGSVLALADLLEQELNVFVAEKPFRVDGEAFDRGAILITREANPDDLEQRLEEIARDRAVQVRAVSTAKAEDGPDLGGEYFHKLIAPRVGIWTGAPVSAGAYGALWHLFDERLRMRFSGLDLMRFNSSDLSRYNVLVFPPARGGAGSYRELLGQNGMKKLEAWIRAGGTAIGIGGGAEFLADEKTGLTKTRLRRQALKRYPPAVMGPDSQLVVAGGNFRAVGLRADKEEENKKTSSQGPKRDSLYDVAPVLGPGAVPFAKGFEQGTPAGKPVNLDDWLKPFLAPGKKEPKKSDLERADERLRRFSPQGTFLRVDIDHEVWLSWGLGDELPVLVRARDTLVAESPVQVAARFADLDRLHLGGLLWPEAAARLAHTAYVTREGIGRGQAILFLNEPEFRGWTLGTRRLLLNALLYGPGLGTDWPTPW